MKNTEFLRDELQDKFNLAFENEDISSLQKVYGKLRKLNRNIKYFETESVDLSDLAENICLSADILLRESGKSVLFCGNSVSCVFSNRQILTKAILEAISNACLFGNGTLITVKAYENDTFVTLEIQNMGLFETFNGNGINYMRNAVKLFDGELLIVSEKECSSVVFTFKKSGNIYPSPNANFIDLVCDRLSPVYIELYGV